MKNSHGVEGFFDKNPDKSRIKEIVRAQKAGQAEVFDNMYHQIGFRKMTWEFLKNSYPWLNGFIFWIRRKLKKVK